MFHRQSVRTLIIALSGGVILTLGAAANAAAAPQGNPDYPLGAQNETPGHPDTGDLNDQAKRAEDLGGDIVTQMIDMSAHLTKCGLNLIVPSVRCD
ncbi:hypothetical protein [Nocardia vaccinii]|uniref:hypothetical protein n=1 Tax=Nocardia vaccinii TaxID=1822 RepID=UPI000B2D7A32|nr:hypothetical protein [Nocardia vaccinii]